MIAVTGTIQFHPDDAEAASALMIRVSQITRDEKGCVLYAFHKSLEEPGLFRVYEEWEDDAALLAHGQAPHMAEFRKGLGALRLIDRKVKKFPMGPETEI